MTAEAFDFDFTAELASITSGLDDAVATLDSLTDLVHRIAHGEPEAEPVVAHGALIDALRDLAILYAGDPRNGETDLILVFGELRIAPGEKHAWVCDGDTVYDPVRGRLTGRSAARTHQPTALLRATDVLTQAGRLLLARHGMIPRGIAVQYLVEPAVFERWASFEPVPVADEPDEPDEPIEARRTTLLKPIAEAIELPDFELPDGLCLVCDSETAARAAHPRQEGGIGLMHERLTKVLATNRLPDAWGPLPNGERRIVCNLLKRFGIDVRGFAKLVRTDRLAIHAHVRRIVEWRLGNDR